MGRMLRNRRAGEEKSIVHAPALAAPDTGMRLSSASFGDQAAIPREHAGKGVGANRSPALEWSGLPAGTAQLLLVIEDTDVPLPRPIVHTVALLDPARGALEAGRLVVGEPGVRLLPASFRRVGYEGPRPIPGHGTHRYGFHLYALDRAIPAQTPVRSTKEVLALVDGRVTASAHLIGTMTRD